MSQYERVVLTGLIFECLCDGKFCPLAPAYELDPAQRVDWIGQLSEKDRKQILLHYQDWVDKLDSSLRRVA